MVWQGQGTVGLPHFTKACRSFRLCHRHVWPTWSMKVRYGSEKVRGHSGSPTGLNADVVMS